MKIMKRFLVIILGCLQVSFSHAQWFSGEYTTEVQWDLKKHTNWLNHLRLDLAIPLWEGKGTLEAATLHVARTREGIIDDWQGHSNIEEDNMLAALAVLGYMHEWKEAHLFVGVRNVNEDFFTSDVTSLFTNGSCGIFPTIAASYPIANFPLSGLTVYFDVGKDGWVLRNSLYNGVGYNGWKHHDNPFRLRPKTDGIFNTSQLEYTHPKGRYYAGVAIHTRQFAIDEEGEQVPAEEASTKTTCAWWVYGEQTLWTDGEHRWSEMAQYSENTSHDNGCYRYAEIGSIYEDGHNEWGVSGQYARFHQGTERSLEVTWKRQFNNTSTTTTATSWCLPPAFAAHSDTHPIDQGVRSKPLLTPWSFSMRRSVAPGRCAVASLLLKQPAVVPLFQYQHMAVARPGREDTQSHLHQVIATILLAVTRQLRLLARHEVGLADRIRPVGIQSL